jgi:hypothetical protein
MKKIWYGVIAIIVLSAIGALADSSEQPESVAKAAQTQSQSEDTPPAPAPEPEGRFGLASCDIELSSDLYGQNYLMGSTEVINTGGVPAMIRTTFKWQLGDGTFIKAQPKQTRLRTGAEKYVFFKVPVASEQISSFQSHPAYMESGNCKTNATIR